MKHEKIIPKDMIADCILKSNLTEDDAEKFAWNLLSNYNQVDSINYDTTNYLIVYPNNYFGILEGHELRDCRILPECSIYPLEGFAHDYSIEKYAMYKYLLDINKNNSVSWYNIQVYNKFRDFLMKYEGKEISIKTPIQSNIFKIDIRKSGDSYNIYWREEKCNDTGELLNPTNRIEDLVLILTYSSYILEILESEDIPTHDFSSIRKIKTEYSYELKLGNNFTRKDLVNGMFTEKYIQQLLKQTNCDYIVYEEKLNGNTKIVTLEENNCKEG